MLCENNPAQDNGMYGYQFNHATGDYGADWPAFYGAQDSDYWTFGSQTLQPIMAGKAMENGWPALIPATNSCSSAIYSPDHTRDEYYADARGKLLYVAGKAPSSGGLSHDALWLGAYGYDWLFNATYASGSPVLSVADKQAVQTGMIGHADMLKSMCTPATDTLFDSGRIANYAYVLVGFALYEPSRVSDPSYATVNAKAASYLADFDTFWLGRIIPALEAQGGDGGWHGGLGKVGGQWNHFSGTPSDDVLLWQLPLFFLAFNTATGRPTHEFVFGSGCLRHATEFQLHAQLPGSINYMTLGGSSPQDGSRTSWVWPMFTHARRRFSTDPLEQRIGELGAWMRLNRSSDDVFGGSWDIMLQTLLEDKWVNPRSPEQIGFPFVRRFQDLGWVSMRSGFGAMDLVSLFFCQKYHWGINNLYSQNCFKLMRKGDLIEGVEANTVRIGGQGQRVVSSYPTVSAGAFAPGAASDVGPGITAFYDNASYTYTLGDATKAYDPVQLTLFTRQLVYIKPDIFVMFDRVATTASTVEKRWRVDPAAVPVVVGTNDLLTVTNGSGMVWLKRLLPAAATVELSATAIDVVPAAPQAQDFFLHVFQAVDAGTAASGVQADDAVATPNGGGYNVQVAGHTLTFDGIGGFLIDGNPPGGGNVAPTVNAGPDRTAVMPGSAPLDGTVTDDGFPNPPGAMTFAWSSVSGPGTVTFANAAVVDTTATFSAVGTYVLRLTANDSARTSSDDVTVTVTGVAPPPPPPTVPPTAPDDGDGDGDSKSTCGCGSIPAGQANWFFLMAVLLAGAALVQRPVFFANGARGRGRGRV
jgi:hypothetical protein